jgi:transposase
MVSIHKIKNREGVIYVRMYEGWRENGKVKAAVVKNFGRLDKLEENGWGTFKELQQKVRNGEIDYISKRGQIIKTVSFDENIRSGQVLEYGHKLLAGFTTMLGIDKVLVNYQANTKVRYNLAEIMQFLVATRIMKPASKLSNYNHQENMHLENRFDYNQISRSLDHFEQVKSNIQLAIHKSISKTVGRTATLVFYDVTNYYFEIDTADEFRKRGPSKEHRPRPIIQMGLFMDMNGIPIAYELFEGNKVDPKTYIPAIEQVKKQFGIERIVTVADKAMNSSNNVTDTYEKGDGWLFSSKFRGKRGAPKDIQNEALNISGWEYNNEQTFAKKSFTRMRKLQNGKTIEEKVLITWNSKYAAREKYKRLEVLKVANNMTKSEIERQLLGKGIKKFLLIEDERGEKVTLSKFCKVNQEQVAFDEQFDGMNVITTSEVDMSDEKIIAAYSQLNSIEDCFRVTKTDLKTRPVFVWTKAHIEAHFLTCFIALVVMKLLYYKLQGKYSIARIIEALRSAQCVDQGDYYQVFANKDLQEILKSFNFNWSKANVRIQDFKRLERAVSCKTF